MHQNTVKNLFPYAEYAIVSVYRDGRSSKSNRLAHTEALDTLIRRFLCQELLGTWKGVSELSILLVGSGAHQAAFDLAREHTQEALILGDAEGASLYSFYGTDSANGYAATARYMTFRELSYDTESDCTRMNNFAFQFQAVGK